MSINRQRKHVLFYAEDEATNNLAQGFVESLKIDDSRCCVFHEFGHGWQSTEEAIFRVKMQRYPLTHLVLVVDCDKKGVARIEQIKADIGQVDFKERIYVLGTAENAERFSAVMASKANVRRFSMNAAGCALADASSADKSCLAGIWSEPELAHNKTELIRLCKNVKDIMFLRPDALTHNCKIQQGVTGDVGKRMINID